MNELQVRISADIANLQSALNKAKASLKSFEESTDKESEKSNVGFRRKIGLIESLTNKAKALRTSLSQATDERQVERYNQELEKTTQELTRLNALGRTLGNASTGAAGGINKLATAQGNANGVAIEFNRIIQDAPFGLIGIGNNIQQLTQSFGTLKQAQGSTGAALKATLASLISPANLAVLAISALTAGFTAYQMGAFDFLKSTEESTDGLEKYNEELQNTIDNLSAFEKVSLKTSNGIEREKIELDSLFAILRDTNINQETRIGAYNKLITLYPTLLEGLTQEKALTGDLTKEYNLLTEAIGKKALAAALEGELIDSFKEQFDIQKQLNQEKNTQIKLQEEANAKEAEFQRLTAKRAEGLASPTIVAKAEKERDKANEQLEKQRQIVELTKQLLTAQGTEAENLKNNLLEVNKELAVLFGFEQGGGGGGNTPTEQFIKRTTDDLTELNILLERAALLRKAAFFEGVEAPVTGESGKASTAGIIPKLPVEEFEKDTEKVKEINETLIDSFTALGTQITNSLGIANNGLRAFLSTVVSNAPKIISAIIKTAQANKTATDSTVESAKKGALANGIFMATETGKTLGPIGLALLPVLIGGALALISSAFSKTGSGGGGGGSVSGGGSAGIPQTFTNANASVPGSFNPDLAGFGAGFNPMGGRLTAEVSGDSLIFVLQQAEEKRRRS